MIQRQSPSSHILKLERELKLLHHQLNHKALLIQIKDSKIQELEKLIPAPPSTHQQGQIQGQLQPSTPTLQKEGVSGVGPILREREEMDVGLQLAAEKEQELSRLRVELEQKDEVIAKLYSQAFVLHKKMLVQDNAMSQLQQQINQLTLNNQSLSKLTSQTTKQASTTTSSRQAEGVGQRSNIILQNIIIQNQKSNKQSQYYQQAKIANQLAIQAMTEETHTMKKTINNYDWKLFCLETELQLANKDRARLKEDLEARDRQVHHYEAQLLQLNAKLAMSQEELQILCEENNFFEMQISQKQMKIQELLIQVDALRGTEDNEQLKELNYSIKEKDDELKEMTKFLKEKISENHQLKVRCSQLESNLEEAQRKKEKAQFENYYLQQKFTQQEEELQSTSDQMEYAEKEIAQLTKQSNAHLLRVQQLEKQTQIMQAIIYEQQQKLYEVNEHRSSLQKKLQEMGSQLNGAHTKYSSLNQCYEKETNHLNMLILTKDNQIQKIVRKMENLQLSLKNKDKTIHILQGELKATRTELKEMRFVSQRYQEELEQMQEVIAVNEEKLKILKRETVGNIENEVNYELQLQNAEKTILSLQLQNKTLQTRHNTREEAFNKLKRQLNDLRKLTQSKADQITSYLQDSDLQEEETTTFQILVEDQSFEVPMNALEKQKRELKKKMNDYCLQVQAICSSSNYE